VDAHAVAVGYVAQRGDLVGGVHGAELGRLRDRDDRRLGVVEIPERVRMVLDVFG
jgi:hypothetical protein